VGTMAMNSNVLNNRPADLKQILLDNSKWYEGQQAITDGGDEQIGKDFSTKEGHTFINLTPDEISQWRDLAKPLHEKYLQDNSAAGPLQAIYDEMESLIQKAQ
jgi:TRAP-type C4-dicarboxylate transport system substrate-binding protein